MKYQPLEIYEIDINKEYLVDEDYNVFIDQEHFEMYMMEEEMENYTGIKDNLEYWIEDQYDSRGMTDLKGSEIIAMIYKEEVKMKEYYKDKYLELMHLRSLSLDEKGK